MPNRLHGQHESVEDTSVMTKDDNTFWNLNFACGMKRQGVSSSHVAASFLGVLVSAGRQMDVWVCVQRSDISLCAEYSPLCTKVHDISQTACPLNASVCSVCRSLCDLYIKKKNQLFRGHIYSLRCPQVSFWGIVTLTLPPWTKLSIAGAVCVCGRLGKKKLSPFRQI